MKVFDSEKIRNIAVVGHGDTGKTTLVSAFLYTSGEVNRLGKVEDGTTVTDYDEDEIERKITINTSLAYCQWKDYKINLLDTPGYRAFVFDAKSSMPAVETALVVVDAVSGVEVQTELVWSFAEEFNVPRIVVINKLDRDNASFKRTVNSLQGTLAREIVPVQLPIGEEKEFQGIIDLITNKALYYELDGKGIPEERDIPADMKDEVTARREDLIEMIAESDDALMEKFFDKGTLSNEDLLAGMAKSIKAGTFYPAFCTAASRNAGIETLLNAITSLCPSPLERAAVTGVDASGEDTEMSINPNGKPLAFVFKTLADPFAGRISLIKSLAGTIKSDSTLRNLGKRADERLGSLQAFQGKNHESLSEINTGDICGILKLKETVTGDTLSDEKEGPLFKPVEYPIPSISFAIEPATRGDEDKIGQSVARIMEEDPSLQFRRDPQTKEFILAGSGQLHIEVSVGKLKRKYGVEVLLKPPKVPYRETITGLADVQGRHKKQSGGHGQFGDCRIRMEPAERSAGFQFVDEIFGGAIPRQYIPAVEKGIIETAERGYLAGFPVVDFKVTLYDGSYHDVDSSEMAFKIAGGVAFKRGMEQAKPVLLEPTMNVEIYAPEENAGDIMGDLNSRRGRIQGMDVKGNTQVVRAQVPMAEMLNYDSTLTSMTGGRGSFQMEISHYDIVPAHLTEKIIEKAKQEAEEDSK